MIGYVEGERLEVGESKTREYKSWVEPVRISKCRIKKGEGGEMLPLPVLRRDARGAEDEPSGP